METCADNLFPGLTLTLGAMVHPSQASFLEQQSGGLTILILAGLLVGALLIVVPQLLRARQRALEMHHAEVMAALEKGQPLPLTDDRSVAAGRTASLVPIIVMCGAATVTCFLAAFKLEAIFSVTLAVWSVAGVVSLAAITGGVALMGRLAQLHDGIDREESPADAQPHPSQQEEEK